MYKEAGSRKAEKSRVYVTCTVCSRNSFQRGRVISSCTAHGENDRLCGSETNFSSACWKIQRPFKLADATAENLNDTMLRVTRETRDTNESPARGAVTALALLKLKRRRVIRRFIKMARARTNVAANGLFRDSVFILTLEREMSLIDAFMWTRRGSVSFCTRFVSSGGLDEDNAIRGTTLGERIILSSGFE